MQPNIIFIMADQLAARYLGTYGSGVDSTPNLDRLAARGIRFDRCYATCPVCAPNRASLLTGRSPVVHGLTTNNYTAPPETPTHPQLLRDNGWRLTRFVQGGGQMFDLNADPDEQNNLYKNPDYADKRQELLERLIDITTRPHRMPQYRNMPVIDGVPHRLGGRGNAQLIPVSADS